MHVGFIAGGTAMCSAESSWLCTPLCVGHLVPLGGGLERQQNVVLRIHCVECAHEFHQVAVFDARQLDVVAVDVDACTGAGGSPPRVRVRPV